MAAANPAESLQDEASCSICLDYFTDPVTTDCGHNFCRSCITQTWKGRDTNFPCPQCRETSQQRNLRSNRQLANMTEMVKKLSQCSVRPKEENLCEEHEEKLKLFCEEDQRAICVVCDRSRDHRSHTVIPIKEAVQEYKEKLKMHLKPLRKNLEDLLKFTSTEEKKAEELKSETQIKRQKVESEFEELQQFLNKEKQILLSRLEEEEKKIFQRIREHETQLEEQSSSLMQLISEIEEKIQQPATELLKDVKDALSRCKKMKFPKPEAVPTDLKMGFQLSYPQQLKEWITKFKDWWMEFGRYTGN
ncbi:E3 ubiquitin-protein ligase TRIM39-like [Microcaecilia unicolor]|uniref:RING-type E3 ubiquitin transferase n=1 Tax=Microcaecilia unicolor TaxID=1415580 RepID=A0A6P7WW07_9AMPH|nr:E3 ubiquitin-protein ligase TRIM39-like [Microcaecilia unicolor]